MPSAGLGSLLDRLTGSLVLTSDQSVHQIRCRTGLVVPQGKRGRVGRARDKVATCLLQNEGSDGSRAAEGVQTWGGGTRGERPRRGPRQGHALHKFLVLPHCVPRARGCAVGGLPRLTRRWRLSLGVARRLVDGRVKSWQVAKVKGWNRFSRILSPRTRRFRRGRTRGWRHGRRHHWCVECGTI